MHGTLSTQDLEGRGVPFHRQARHFDYDSWGQPSLPYATLLGRPATLLPASFLTQIKAPGNSQPAF